MTQFGADQTKAEEIPVYNTPKQGVSKQPTGWGALSNLFDSVTEYSKGIKESKQDSFLGDFAKQQMAIADGYEQGAYGQSVARTRMRKNLFDAVNSNKSMASEIIKLQASLDITGATGIVSEGTMKDQIKEAQIGSLVSTGLLDPDDVDSEDKVQSAEATFQALKSSELQFKERMRTLDMAKEEHNLTVLQRQGLQEKRKQAAFEFARGSTGGYIANMRSQFDTILSSNMSEADKVAEIDKVYTNFQANATENYLMYLSSTESNLVMTPFEQTKELYMSLAKGDLRRNEVDNRINDMVSVQKEVFLSNPKLASMAAAQDLFNLSNFDVQLQSSVLDEVLDVIEANGSGRSKSSFDLSQDAIGEYFRNLEDVMKDPDKAVKAVEHLDSFLGNVADFERQVSRDPEKAISLINMMATSRFYSVMKSNPEKLTNREDASTVLTEHFGDEVWVMVQNEFKNSNVYNAVPNKDPNSLGGPYSVDESKTPDAVGYRQSGVGIEFFAINPDNSGARQKARSLNKRLKPIINKTVQAMSHLNGHNNYSETWKQIETQLMGNIEGQDSGDDLTLDDFDPIKGGQGEDILKALPKNVAEDTEFLSGVQKLSDKLGVNVSDMLGVMDFETDTSFGTGPMNSMSSATGLIGFMRETAKDMGTSVEALSKLSRTEQLQYVEQYFAPYANRLKGKGIDDLYMAVLWPKAIGKNDDYVLFRKGDGNYGPNSGLDINNSGTVTKAEAAAKVRERANKYASK